MQRWIAHGGDLLSERLRCVRDTNERRCRRLHKLYRERVDVPAHVWFGLYRFRNELMQRWNTHGSYMLCKPMRRVWCSYELRRRRLHELPGERLHVPADL